MNIHLERKWLKLKYTVGRLYIDGEFICNTLEDTDRNLCEGMSEEAIKARKVYGETAIPRGRYEVVLDVYSPSFGKREYYRNFCKGYLPRLLDVKGFDGILMHRGVNQNHTEGCILLGYNTIKGQLTDSQKAFEKVYLMMKEAVGKGEQIWIDID